jgi:hypothetical protein
VSTAAWLRTTQNDLAVRLTLPLGQSPSCDRFWGTLGRDSLGSVSVGARHADSKLSAHRSIAWLRAASLPPFTLRYAVINGPNSHGHTVP